MLIFAYTVLVLALAAGLAVYAFRYHSLKATILWKARNERIRESQASIAQQVAAMAAKLTEIEHKTRNTPGAISAPVNPFTKSEQRHAAALKTVVDVNGQPVRTA